MFLTNSGKTRKEACIYNHYFNDYFAITLNEILDCGFYIENSIMIGYFRKTFFNHYFLYEMKIYLNSLNNEEIFGV